MPEPRTRFYRDHFAARDERILCQINGMAADSSGLLVEGEGGTATSTTVDPSGENWMIVLTRRFGQFEKLGRHENIELIAHERSMP